MCVGDPGSAAERLRRRSGDHTHSPSPDATQHAPDGSVADEDTLSVRGEVWADNWFAFYLGEHVIIEDSTPITTERSFNAETLVFEAEYPLQMNFVASDFRENDMGLEDIGRRNQQMGDGGLIAQFTDTAQETISRPQTPPADAWSSTRRHSTLHVQTSPIRPRPFPIPCDG